MKSDLVRIDEDLAKAAAETLRKAFTDYPLITYYYPETGKQEKITRYFTTYAVYSGIRYGEVYASSEKMEGVAVWMRSEHYPLTFGNMIRSVSLRVLFGLMTSGFERMRAVGVYLDEVHKWLAPEKHMYLQTIGVDPSYQGKGFSGKLIRPMLSRLDEEELPCYLETLSEKNASIYEHLGFKLVERTTIPGTTLENFAMLRDPAK